MAVKKETVKDIFDVTTKVALDVEKALQDDIKNPDNYRDILAYLSTALLTVITSFS